MRSNAEWQELLRSLRKIVEDPAETRERKQKAQRILDSVFMGAETSSIGRSQWRKSDTRGVSSLTEAEYDGTIR